MIRLFLLLLISTTSFAQGVVTFKNVTLDSALIRIAELKQIDIIFNHHLTESHYISGKFSTDDLSVLLEDVLSDTFLTFEIKSSLIIIKKNTTVSSLQGFIYDTQSGEPLISVYVYVKALGIGTTTNTDGFFNLPNIPVGKHSLTLNLLGYKSHEEPVSVEENTNFFTYTLDESTEQGETIQVVSDKYLHKMNLIKNSSVLSLNPQLMSKAPQMSERDLFRTLQTLPGITPTSDMSADLNIRGGSTDQNLYLLDGAIVYNPSHLMGFFSSFNTDVIKKVDIYKSGFPVEYGGRLSSVIDVTQLDGNKSSFQGSSSLSLITAKTNVEIPINERITTSASFRRTTMELVLNDLYEELPDYYFYDFQTKTSVQLNEKNKLTLSYLTGFDKFKINENPQSSTAKGFWENNVLSLNWTSVLSAKLFAKIWLTESKYKVESDERHPLYLTQRIFKNTIIDRTLKSKIHFQINSEHEENFGFEIKEFQNNLYNEQVGQWISDFKGRKSLLFATYFDHQYKLTDKLTLKPGVRYSHYSLDKNFSAVSPRLNVNYSQNGTTQFQYSVGKIAQFFQYIRQSGPGIWLSLDKNRNVSTVVQHNLSVKHSVGNAYDLSLDVFRKDYKNLYLPDFFFETYLEPESVSNSGLPIYSNTKGLFREGEGLSYGIEVLIKKNRGKLTGWLSYSYNDDHVKYEKMNKEHYFRPDQFRKHSVKVVSTLSLNKHLDINDSEWSLGLSLFYHSGQPLTVPTSHYIGSNSPGKLGKPEFTTHSEPTQLNNINSPYYMRMDATLSYKSFHSYGKLTAYLSIFNLGNRENYLYQENTGRNLNWNNSNIHLKTTQNENYQLPLLPSIGVVLDF